MKRLTTKLISSSKITTSSTSTSGNFTTQFTASSSSISKSPIQQPCINHNLKPCSNYPFHNNPSHNYSTHVGITPYYPSNHSKITKRSQIEDVFKSTKSAAELIEAFKIMEANLGEVDIGLACIEIVLRLDKEGEDPQKNVSFANRALSVFDKKGENKYCLYVAITLELLGSAYYRLRKFNDALECLNRANKIMLELQNDGKYGAEDIMPVLHAFHIKLANIHAAKGMIEAYLDNLRKALEIKEFLMGKNSREFGNANREFAEAFVAIKNFKDGLPYCLKALEIHLALLGENSVEVAHDRRVLGVVYAGMGEYKKALEENRLAQKVFRICGCSSDWVRAGIDAADIYIVLGMFEYAMQTLNGIVEDTDDRSHILITMGKMFFYQEKFADAKRCMENASSVLDKKEKSKPLEVSLAYVEISMQYHAMNEFENAISLLKRALALLEMLPGQQHLRGSVSGRIGWLLLLTGKVTQAIPYLESVVETVKESYGSKHCDGGYIYNNLGVAYLELKRLESAAQMFAAAKDTMDAFLGPHHNDSIQACQNLSKAYAAMKSYPLAIEFQQKAVDAWEGHGRSAEDELREARQLLELLKAIAHGASSTDYPTKALPLPYSRAASRGLQAPQPSSPK